MLRTRFSFLLVIILLTGVSCINTKKAVYFADVQDKTFTRKGAEVQTPIQPNNILSITISSLNAEASAMFNPSNNYNNRATTATGSSTESGGYLVDADGNIQLPVLGSIKAAGLTKQELRDNITNLILSRKLLIDPTVEIRFLNFEVTVIGEVGHPTVITVPSEKITLLKAIGLAGDITVYGLKDNVLLIREENGVKQTRHIDLTSSDFFNSPYYNLQPNDVVYVEPSRSKIASASRSVQWLPVIFSALSALTVILTYVKF